MADDGKSLSEEVADLTEAVHELRDREVAGEIASLKDEIAKLREERAVQPCHGHHGCCCCGHWHVYYTPTWYQPQPVYTQITATSGGISIGSGTYVNTAGAAYQGSTYTISCQ